MSRKKKIPKILDTEMRMTGWGWTLRSGCVNVRIGQVGGVSDGAWYCSVWVRKVCLTPHAAMNLKPTGAKKLGKWQAKTERGAAMKATRLLERVLGSINNMVWE